MKGTIVVETQEEYDKWIATLKPQYTAAHPEGGEAKPSASTDAVKTTDKPVALNAGQ